MQSNEILLGSIVVQHELYVQYMCSSHARSNDQSVIRMIYKTSLYVSVEGSACRHEDMCCPLLEHVMHI